MLEPVRLRVALLHQMQAHNHAMDVIPHVALDVIVHVLEHVMDAVIHADQVETVLEYACLHVIIIAVKIVNKTVLEHVTIHAKEAVVKHVTIHVLEHVTIHAKVDATAVVKGVKDVQIAQAAQELVMKAAMICAETVQEIVLLPAQMHVVIIVTASAETIVAKDVLHHAPVVHHRVSMIVVQVAEIYARTRALLFVVLRVLINVEDVDLVVITFALDIVEEVA